CWGENLVGALGDGTKVDRYTPVEVIGLSNVTALSTGLDESYALHSDGSVDSWGWNPLAIERISPMPVTGLPASTAIATGNLFTCAITVNGPFCLGKNDMHQLGNGMMMMMATLTPTPVSNLSGGLSISVGESYACARDALGFACWGTNGLGQLGDGTTMSPS